MHSKKRRKNVRLCIVMYLLLFLGINPAYPNQPPPPIRDYTAQIKPLTLSEKEKRFLKDRSVIRIGTDHGWDPFVIVNENGPLEGFEVDMMALFSAMTGSTFQIVADRWAKIQEQAKKREIDGLADSTVNKNREQFFNFTISYLQLYPVFVVRNDSDLQINTIDDLSGKTVSILEGNTFNLALLEKYPEIKIIESLSEKDAIKLTIEGKADATLIAANTFSTHYRSFSNIIKIGLIDTDHSLNLVYSIRKDWPELISILNKAIASIPRDLYDEIFHKWFNMNPVHQKIKLKKIDTVIIDNYAPYSFVNEKGEPDGYTVDIIKAVAKEIDMEIVIRTEIWENALIKLLKGQINTLPMMAYSEKREVQYDFSPPHTISYDTFFTNKAVPPILKTEDLIGKRIVVMKNDRAHDYLKSLPFIDPKQLIFENNSVEALRKVSSGKGDAVIMPKLSGIVLLKKYDIKDINVSSSIIHDYNRLFSFAVKEGDTELLAKLENGLQIIKEKGEYKRIYDKWFGVYEAKDLTFIQVLKYFLWLVVLFSLFVGTLLLWSVMLKRQVTQRTQKLELEIQDRKRVEKALSHEKNHLQKALNEIKILKGLLPICANCKKIRDDQGYWNQMEAYISKHSEAQFSHGICPECVRELYPDLNL